ncbi:WHG domain-containing protein [Paenibacillus sp. GCM10027627]|uniref:TetR/AcrR family transcriptional regulator n=1 Tax=unclassified Paenibacillus TaxID=185978 RepID=UPI003637047C
MSPRAGLDLNTIVGAAALLADEEGLEAVTLAALAQRLGVRSPSLYNHVNGLPALKSHMMEYALKELLAVLRDAAGVKSASSIESIAKSYMIFARTRPGLYPLTLGAPTLAEGEHARLAKELVELMLESLAACGLGLTDEAGIHAVRGLRSLLHGFAAIESHSGFGMPIDVDDSVRYVLKAYLNGLKRPDL